MDTEEFSWPEGKRVAVSLSFDDARLTQPDVGFDILDRHDVRGTFYVTPRNVRERLDAWRAAAQTGHEIGNHTVTHPCSGNFPWARTNALEDYTLERMERELLDANAQIEDMLDVTPKTFAYPCGHTFIGRGENLRSYVPLVAKHFRVGRGAFDEIANDPAFCDLALVTGIDLDRTPWERAGTLIRSAATEGRWLVLFGHEVAPEGRQATSPVTLERLCEFCTDPTNGIWIDTVAAVGEYVRTLREGRPV